MLEFAAAGGILPCAELLTVTYRHSTDELDIIVPQMIVAGFAVYFLLDLFISVRRRPLLHTSHV